MPTLSTVMTTPSSLPSTVRVQVEGRSVYSSGVEVTFSIWGIRFRKGGLSGKRTERFWIVVENDLEPQQKTLVH